MIKRVLLIMVSACFSLQVQATDDKNVSESINNVSLYEQVGRAALAFPNQQAAASPEALGLMKLDAALVTDFWLSDTIVIAELERQSAQKRLDNENQLWISSDNIVFNQPVTNTNIGNRYPAINAGFSFGRFSAKTSVVSSEKTFDNNSYYLQGSFAIIAKEQFNLSVTASYTTLDNLVVNRYFGVEHAESFGTLLETKSASNTSLGIVGTYNLTPHWKLIGAITSTNVDKQIEASPLINNNYLHSAQFGTSYSF